MSIDWAKINEQVANGTNVVGLSVARLAWEYEGQTVIGKVVAIADHYSDEYDKTQKKYIMENETGKFSLFLNDSTDANLSAFNILNQILVITFNGYEDLGKGRRYKKFDIKMLNHDER